MQYDKFNKTYRKIFKNINNKRLSKAFSQLRKLIYNSQNNKAKNTFENLQQTYNFLLEYTFKGVNDPQREQIYNKTRSGLINLTDLIKKENFINEQNCSQVTAYSNYYKNPANQNAVFEECIKEINTNKINKDTFIKLFFNLWLSIEIPEDSIPELRKIALNKKVDYQNKCLIVTAITLSLLTSYDINKTNALFEFYDSTEEGVSNRALVGIVMAFYMYDKRLFKNENIKNRLSLLADEKDTKENLLDIVLQFIRTKETKRISDKLRDEVLPEMKKMQPKIFDKLDLDKISNDRLEDQNPDWENIFGDASGLLGKMEELSKLQLEGSDVFMTAFSELKHFPFFYDFTNWFMPFYRENEELESVFNDDDELDKDKFFEALEKSAFICNSDKYSFCFNVKMLPTQQKKMILDLFKMELNAMNEISGEDKKLNKNLEDKYIFTRYIQDLYRFLKLHPCKNIFPDIFEEKLDIHNTKFFKTILPEKENLIKVAEFYFKKNYFSDAVKIFKKADLSGERAKSIYEKIAFAYQKEGNYKKALKFYLRAELLDSDSVWLNKKIAFCYRKIQDYEKALEFYKRTEEQEAENLHVQANMGHCYFAIEKYDEALKHFHKVEYFQSQNTAAMRPIAWIAFITGDLEKAEKYYKRIIRLKATFYDFINMGHILLIKNDKTEAVNNYLKAVEKSDLKTVVEEILSDEKYLIENNIDKFEINLLTDYLGRENETD